MENIVDILIILEVFSYGARHVGYYADEKA
jgi:hypothetical protein